MRQRNCVFVWRSFIWREYVIPSHSHHNCATIPREWLKYSLFIGFCAGKWSGELCCSGGWYWAGDWVLAWRTRYKKMQSIDQSRWIHPPRDNLHDDDIPLTNSIISAHFHSIYNNHSTHTTHTILKWLKKTIAATLGAPFQSDPNYLNSIKSTNPWNMQRFLQIINFHLQLHHTSNHLSFWHHLIFALTFVESHVDCWLIIDFCWLILTLFLRYKGEEMARIQNERWGNYFYLFI